MYSSNNQSVVEIRKKRGQEILQKGATITKISALRLTILQFMIGFKDIYHRFQTMSIH